MSTKSNNSTPAFSKWSTKVWQYITDRFSENSSSILVNRELAIKNKERLDKLENTVKFSLKKIEENKDAATDLSNSVTSLFDSTKHNFDKIASLDDRVSKLDGLHDGDEMVLVFEQVGHQPVTRYYGVMKMADVQDFVDEKGRSLYVAGQVAPTPPPVDEEE